MTSDIFMLFLLFFLSALYVYGATSQEDDGYLKKVLLNMAHSVSAMQGRVMNYHSALWAKNQAEFDSRRITFKNFRNVDFDCMLKYSPANYMAARTWMKFVHKNLAYAVEFCEIEDGLLTNPVTPTQLKFTSTSEPCVTKDVSLIPNPVTSIQLKCESPLEPGVTKDVSLTANHPFNLTPSKFFDAFSRMESISYKQDVAMENCQDSGPGGPCEKARRIIYSMFYALLNSFQFYCNERRLRSDQEYARWCLMYLEHYEYFFPHAI